MTIEGIDIKGRNQYLGIEKEYRRTSERDGNVLCFP